MPEYELVFVICEPSESVEQLLIDELDAFVGGHGDVSLLTAAATAADAISAARTLIARVVELGGQPLRAYDDLVTRNQIAARAEVTPQAVGAWIRNERQQRVPFPLPHVLGPAELWRWGDVNEWLRSVGKRHDDVMYPSALEIAKITVLLGEQPYLAGDLLAASASVVPVPDSTWVAGSHDAGSRFAIRQAS